MPIALVNVYVVDIAPPF